MERLVLIPLFPLRVLPLPGELVPLHIFEPRYKQLLQEVESRDIRFGIYFDHPLNEQHVGAMMRLETVTKRYPKGELDIIVKCEDMFTLHEQHRLFPGKLYPGGHVAFWSVDDQAFPDEELYTLYNEFRSMRGVATQARACSVYEIANELGFDFADRYKFITLADERRNSFLQKKVEYHIQLMKHEERSKDVFHLN
jgi:uncharacterized protein